MSIFDSYYGYGYPSSAGNMVAGLIICLVLAIIGGIVLYLTFLSKKNSNKFTGFLGWLYDTLSFNKFLLEVLLKVTYLMVAGFITLYSFVLLFSRSGGFLPFIMLLIFGNIGFRLIYEFSMLLLTINRHASEINKKLGPLDNERPAQPPQAPYVNPPIPPQGAYQQPYQQQTYQQQPYQPQDNQQAYQQQGNQQQAYQPQDNQQAYQQQDNQQQAYQPQDSQQQAYQQPAYQAPSADLPAAFCAQCGTRIEAGVVNCPNCNHPRR